MRRLLLAASVLSGVGATFIPDNQSIVVDGAGVAHTSAPLRIATSSGAILASDLAGVVNFSGANLTATIPNFPARSTVVVCNYDATALALSPSSPIKGYSSATLPGLNGGSASCLNLTSDGGQWWAMAIIPGGGGGGATTPPPTGDTLVLQMSEDYYLQDAQFNVYLDGVKLNTSGYLVNTAIRPGTQAFTFTGAWGPGTHTLGIEFLNDQYAGPGKDLNLYLDSATYDGVTHQGGLNFYDNGLQTITVP